MTGGMFERWGDSEEETEARDPPRDRDELRVWLDRFANVQLPDRACRDGHTSPLDAVWEAYAAESPRTVWHASRGFGGKSVALACLVYLEAITLGAEVTLLGGSLEQSQRVHQYLNGERRSLNHGRVFWEAAGAPRSLLEGDPTRRKTALRTGGSIEVLTASQKSVRGPHPQRLRGDEIDEMDQAIWDAAQGQAQEAAGIREQTVGSSTWQNAKGTMTNEFKQARQMGWPVRRWCWECTLDENGGWLSREAALRKFETIPAHMRQVEYDLEEPSSEGTLFDRDALDAMFDNHPSRLAYEGGLNTEYRFEPAESGAEYAAGGDWGKARDRSIIIVLRIDVEPVRVVYYRHMGRIPFPQMVEAFNAVVEEYDAVACHDATGIGAVIDDYLEVMSEAVVMVGKRRSDLFGQYVVGIEAEEILCPDIGYLRDEHKWCTVGDVYTGHGERGHPPDTVVAMAMAWRAASGMDLLI